MSLQLIGSAASRLVLGALLWWALVEGDESVFGYGLVLVPIVVAVSYRVSDTRWPLTPRRLVAACGLAGWVAWRSVLGGFDVARRALWLPRPDVEPQWLVHTTVLATARARVAFAFTMSLMPGTLSASLEGDRIDVHVIASDLGVERTLAELERRIGATFEGG